MRKSHRVPIVAAVAAAAVWAFSAPAFAGTSDEEANRAWGKELFGAHCATCHGADAKGNGPSAASLKIPPKDLTRISERHEGKFPPNLVEEVIDGQLYYVSHGDREMPIWGDVFAKGTGQHAARARVYALRLYLESIQAPPSKTP